MLSLSDAVQAAPNTIYVQQAAQGTPEWIKTLITAAVGAFVGIISSSIMEVLKPRIASAISRKETETQLIEELRANVGALTYLRDHPEGGITGNLESDGALPTVEQKLRWADDVISSIRDSRYRIHFQTNRLLLYQIDAGGYLEMFYSQATANLANALAAAKESPDNEHLDYLYRVVGDAITTGLFFLKTRPGAVQISDLRRHSS